MPDITYTQANRPMRLTTPLGDDELLLAAFSGEETISRLFMFQLDLLSANGAVDAAELLGKPVDITLLLPHGGERHFNGIVSRFTTGGRDADMYSYRAEVVPTFWLLTRRRGSRIFQEMSVLEIVEAIFKERGLSDFRIDCISQYPKREFCVQYRETDFDFINRLLEDEGIFYYFEHSADAHVLVLTDSNSSAPPVPGSDVVEFASPRRQERDVINSWEKMQELRTGKYTLWDYCFEKPDSHLEASVDGDNEYEIYDYPGGYQQRDDGEVYARIRLEAEEVLRETVRAAGTTRQMVAGHKFTLERHFSSDGEYILTSVQHAAQLGDFRSDQGGGLDYSVQFDAIPIDVPFRPQRITRKPVIRGTQTALVVGKKGEEIWVDKYGRIKVQFHWDREGQKDENSSCWIRVAMPWAGKGWGSVSLPRIGNEVVISFLEGDPDRPIVVGSVYNANQTPPFDLPGSGIQMGMKSRSSPGGGGMNEMTMTDTKGKEKITIHGQYNMDTTVENDQTLTVHNNRTATVDVDETITIGANQAIEVGGNQDEKVKGNQTLAVDGNRDASVKGNQSTNVTGNDELKVDGSRAVDVTGTDSLAATGDQSIETQGNSTLKAAGNVTVDGSGNVQINAGGSVLITAGSSITLSVGGSTVNVTGGSIDIVSSGMVTVMGALVKVN